MEPVRGGAPLLADVKPSAWYAPAVDFVLDKGIMEMDGNMSSRDKPPGSIAADQPPSHSPGHSIGSPRGG